MTYCAYIINTNIRFTIFRKCFNLIVITYFKSKSIIYILLFEKNIIKNQKYNPIDCLFELNL